MKIKLLFLAAFLLFARCAFAEDTVTITTYYPSPYGVYNRLQAYSFGVGDNNSNDTLDSGDVPTDKGNVWIKGGVGIGTMDVTEKLVVQGRVKIVDGYQEADKVLTSDAYGVGTWKAAGGGVKPGTLCGFRAGGRGPFCEGQDPQNGCPDGYTQMSLPGDIYPSAYTFWTCAKS